MNEYIKTLTYGLKNLEKTRETYKNYKTREFNMLMKKWKDTVKVHFKYLGENIIRDFYFGDMKYFFSYLNLENKVDVRFLKTNINHVCQELNREFIESIVSRPNRNKIKCFAIRFYLRYYITLNKIMHNTLKEIMERSEG